MTALSPAQHARLSSILICGAVGDLEFDKRGNVRYCHNRFENEANYYGPILIEVNGGGMTLTPDGCDFLLENLQGGCYSKHDERTMLAVARESHQEYQRNRQTIDAGIETIRALADELAEAKASGDSNRIVLGYNKVNSALNAAKAALSPNLYNMIRDAYRAKIDL
jgi:hypothetical protein